MASIQALVDIKNKKAELEKQREHRIKKKIIEVNRSRLAAEKPERHKPSHYLKTKKIQKKQVKTIVEKTRTEDITLQANVNACTFINKSQAYNRVYERTKQLLKIDVSKLREACQMIFAFAKDNPKERNLYVNITFDSELKCVERPIQITLPFSTHTPKQKCILITEFGKRKQEQLQRLKDLNVQILSFQEFVKKLHDATFKKLVLKASTKLFCDFKIYSKIQSNSLYRVISRSNVIFPIENGKVPYQLREKFGSYEEYISDLCRHSYFVSSSQKQQQTHFYNI